MGHILKYFEIWVKVGHMGHRWPNGSKNSSLLEKKSDTLKNRLLLENSLTAGKITPILENRPQFKKVVVFKNGLTLKNLLTQKIEHTLFLLCKMVRTEK